ncbi:DUF4333 domain-containing protein [Smaragdicoccus niigatensis]|uniref:DUF4333 domain-containing protein n=1 Tax=Smaragdicoccus niigatensis TaxID=359359 RepID=UPI00039990E8|nr:DUF4333 domain-containing protein [Smaragdicoccus niigatensis]
MIRTRNLHRPALACACFALICGPLSACSSGSASEAVSVDKAQIIKTLNDAARQNLGAPFDKLDCDKGLKPTIGDKSRCIAESGGVRAAFDVSVTSIDKGNLNFDWTLDENSRVVTAEAVEKEVRPKFKDQTGADLKTFDCMGDIPGRAGGTGICTATGTDGVAHKVNVTVSSADGMGVGYEWNIESPKPDPKKKTTPAPTTSKRPN